MPSCRDACSGWVKKSRDRVSATSWAARTHAPEMMHEATAPHPPPNCSVCLARGESKWTPPRSSGTMASRPPEPDQLQTLKRLLDEAEAQLPPPPPLHVVQLEALLLSAAVQLGDADVLAVLGAGGSPDSKKARVGSQWLAMEAQKAAAALLIQRVSRGNSTRTLLQGRKDISASDLMLMHGSQLQVEVAQAKADEAARGLRPVPWVAQLRLLPSESASGGCHVNLDITLPWYVDDNVQQSALPSTASVEPELIEAHFSDSSSEGSADDAPDDETDDQQLLVLHRIQPALPITPCSSAAAPHAPPADARRAATAATREVPAAGVGARVALSIVLPEAMLLPPSGTVGGVKLRMDVTDDDAAPAVLDAFELACELDFDSGGDAHVRLRTCSAIHSSSEAAEDAAAAAATRIVAAAQAAAAVAAAAIPPIPGPPTAAETPIATVALAALAAPPSAAEIAAPPPPPKRTGSAPRPPLPPLSAPMPPPLPPRPNRGFPGSPPNYVVGGGQLSARAPDWANEWWASWPACCANRRRDKPAGLRTPTKPRIVNAGFGGSPVVNEPFGTPILSTLLRHYDNLQQRVNNIRHRGSG